MQDLLAFVNVLLMKNYNQLTLMEDNVLLTNVGKVQFMEAVKYLCKFLLDAIEFTEVSDSHSRLVVFLAAEGVLMPFNSFLKMIKLSSSMKLDILKILQIVVTFFDVNLIHLAPLCYFKKVIVSVNDESRMKVPKKGIYD
ncbi:14036_t:CDS:2 [Funneliformis caledonium]|uniref:14036_t:CDS:1 n=1 Tax=Funneliformis caledonium TaxID=1117310 RepID=A0A9N9FGM4_9GLOM|nr:14036_t:CDS:2 [Funneliformis caledonium]